MAKLIDPDTLKQVRDEKKWSMDELARRAALDKQSIHRLERGAYRSTRQATIDKLSKALGVSEDILTGKTIRRSRDSKDDALNDLLFSEHQFNVRIHGAARNAFTLVANHCKIGINRIVEFAPILFYLAAERSLQHRREQLAKLESAFDAVEDLETDFPHLARDAFWRRYRAPIEEEIASVERRDFFGELIDREPEFTNDSEYEDAEKNPFVIFLQEELDKCGDGEELSWFSVTGPPHYRVCIKKAAAFVGNDQDAMNAILNGTVLLNEIPKEIRKGLPEQRAEWVKDRAENLRKQLDEAFPYLDKI
jgi:transcriptional regulator with XRE-family HTH domain